MTFVVRVWVPSFVVVLSALLCPGRQVATRSSSPLGWFWSFPRPQVAPCLLWLGRSWGGMVKSPGLNFAPSLLNFVPSLLNFIHNSLSLFHTSSLPSSPFSALWLRYASLGSPPPCSRPLRRGHFELVYLPLSPTSLVFPGVLVAASLGGQRLRPVLHCMGTFSLSTKSWFHLFVPQTEQNDCPNYSVMVNL